MQNLTFPERCLIDLLAFTGQVYLMVLISGWIGRYLASRGQCGGGAGMDVTPGDVELTVVESERTDGGMRLTLTDGKSTFFVILT
jgi:hypothetical protein